MASVLLLRSRRAGARVIFFFLLSHIREPLQRKGWSWGMTDISVGPRARHQAPSVFTETHSGHPVSHALSSRDLRSCCGRSLRHTAPARPPFCVCIPNQSLVPKTCLPDEGSVAIISGPTAPPGGQCRSSQPQLRSRSPQSRGTIQVLSGFLLP